MRVGGSFAGTVPTDDRPRVWRFDRPSAVRISGLFLLSPSDRRCGRFPTRVRDSTPAPGRTRRHAVSRPRSCRRASPSRWRRRTALGVHDPAADPVHVSPRVVRVSNEPGPGPRWLNNDGQRTVTPDSRRDCRPDVRRRNRTGHRLTVGFSSVLYRGCRCRTGPPTRLAHVSARRGLAMQNLFIRRV